MGNDRSWVIPPQVLQKQRSAVDLNELKEEGVLKGVEVSGGIEFGLPQGGQSQVGLWPLIKVCKF